MGETNEFSFLLKPSTVGGVGVFAAHDIKKGTKLALNKEGGESRKLRKSEIPQEFLQYCIALEDGWYKCPLQFNHMWMVWYLNHSKIPNAEWNEKENNYHSIKNISAGEEILIDYKRFSEPEDKKEDYYK